MRVHALALTASAIAAALAGCGGSSPQGTPSGDNTTTTVECNDSVVTWRGQAYGAYDAISARAEGSLGNARRADCTARENSGAPAPLTDVPISRVRGVPPAVAIAVSGDDSVYIAEGYLLPLRSHPLHGRVYGRTDRPPRPSPRCRDTYDWTGSVAAVPAGATGIYVRPTGERDAFLELHARTRVSGFVRAGHPYLREGDLVRVRGVRCANGDLVLNSLSPSS
jgi:hypothetical protein